MVFPPKVYQFLVSVFASVGSILYGYDLGVIAGVVASPDFEARFQASEAQEGAVVSVFTGGAFFGAMFAGPAGDYLGRRLTILIGSIIFCLGGALQTAAQNLEYLYAGRVIAGVGVGFLVMIIPLYQAEIAHPSIRGSVTALQQFMLGIGALIAAWTTYGCNRNFPDDSAMQWRVSLAIQIVPAGILALLIMFFPESPRWLIDHGKAERGLRTLAKLHAHGNEQDTWVRAEYDQIRDSIAHEHENSAKSYLELFRNRSCFRRLLLVVAIQASVQMTGVSAIQYYSPTIFGQMGIGTEDTLKYQGISSVLALLAQMVCIAAIDKVGRRWAMIGGNLTNCVFFTIATIMLALYPPGSTNNASASWAFIATTWLYNISFSATNGPLSWIVPAEVFDTRTRSKGVSIGVMVSFAFNTLIGQITPIAMRDVGWRYYILFVVCNFTNALYFWAFQPETKKRPLEEMNYLFTNAPLFVPTMDMKDFVFDIEHRVMAIEEKEGVERRVDA